MEQNIFLLVFAFLTALLIGAAALVTVTVLAVKSGDRVRIKYTMLSVLCVLAAAICGFFNFGWIRTIATVFAIPVIHTLFFVLVCFRSLPFFERSAILSKYVLWSDVTYLAAYLFLPDGGDSGSYVFFGRIRHDGVIEIAYLLSFILFVVNLVLLCLQIAEKKRYERGNVPSLNNRENKKSAAGALFLCKGYVVIK